MGTKHILVTGGSGFIGSHLCQQLSRSGYSLHVLTRNTPNAKQRLPDGVQLLEDLTEFDATLDCHGVINLAGEPLVSGRWNQQRKQQFYDSRVGTTDALYDYFVRAPQPPKVLINGSAIGYYGPHGDEPLDEEGAVNNCYSHQLCDAWESSAKRFADMGCRVCCIRIGVVLGPKEGALTRMLPAFKMGLGGRLGSGRQWFSWIHIDDMVGILQHCLEHAELRGPVNATAPGAVTNGEFTRQLAAELHRPAWMHMPAAAARLLFGEMADELLLSGQKVVPAKLQAHGFQFRYPTLPEALQQVIAA